MQFCPPACMIAGEVITIMTRTIRRPLGRPPGDDKRPVHFRVRAEIKAALRAAAVAQGRSMSELISDAMLRMTVDTQPEPTCAEARLTTEVLAEALDHAKAVATAKGCPLTTMVAGQLAVDLGLL